MPLSASDAGCVLALDLGTSSVRAGFHDVTGEPLAGTRVAVPLEVETRPPGAATLEASVVVAAVEEAIDGALARLPAGARPQAVGASCMWHSLLGVDAAGAPLTPLYTWADRRAAGAAARLREVLDEREVHRRTGCRLHSSYPLARLAWLHDGEPALRGRGGVARWVSLAEQVLFTFTGTWRVSPSMASGSGLCDLLAARWDPSLLAACGVHEVQLSPVEEAPVTGLRSPYRERWPLLADLPWLPAAGDGACANLGAGAVGPSRLGLTLGTSGALRRLSSLEGRTAAGPFGLWRYRAGRSRLVEGGALSDAGNLFAWLRRTLALPPPEVLEAELAALPPDGHGLTFVPRFAGERGPGWADRDGGVIAGLTLATRPVELARAALEAVALRLALIASELDPSGSGPVVASGAALLASPAWRQIVADALGRPLIGGPEEASSRGAALLALEAVGAIADAAAVAPPEGEVTEVTEPIAANSERYRAALDRQRALIAALPGQPT